MLAFDGRDHFFRVHSGNGLYYGLAQDNRHVYISCRNQTKGPQDAAVRAQEAGSILVLDAASLLPTGELSPEFALRDVHGIACFDGKLWVTCSFDNMVAVYDLTARLWTKWYPAIDLEARGRDVNHFNTIVPNGNRICLLAHNNGRSHLLFYDRSALELCSALELGYQAHDIFAAGGGVATCSSSEGVLVGNTGWRLRTGAFPRGVACDKEGALIGISQVAHRSIRHETSSIVRRFTPDWHHTADYLLPDVGMILAIHRLDLDPGVLATLEPFDARCFRGEYNPLEPGDTYRGSGDNAVFKSEWHSGEETHRWTGAREAHMTVVVNPGEKAMAIDAYSGFPGPYWAEILVREHHLGTIHWSEPGHASSRFLLPPGVQGTCDVIFRVPHLWQPAICLGAEDKRMLGVSVHQLKID